MTLPLSLSLVAAVAGIISHTLYFIHGEHHRSAAGLFKTSLVLPLLFFVAQFTFHNSKIHEATKATLVATGVYAFALFASMLLYRAFFHRLKAFPGPYMAKLSKLWHVKQVARNCDNFLLMDALHKRYGEFVRIGEIQH